MATDLFLEMAELPATGSLGTGQLDTRDLLVAGVPISISSKYLYLYLELSGSTGRFTPNCLYNLPPSPKSPEKIYPSNRQVQFTPPPNHPILSKISDIQYHALLH